MSDKKSSKTESDVAEASVGGRNPTSSYGRATWGPWLFNGALILSLLFMWWLVIYDHGVVSHH